MQLSACAGLELHVFLFCPHTMMIACQVTFEACTCSMRNVYINTGFIVNNKALHWLACHDTARKLQIDADGNTTSDD